jgi:hypothetical protein
MFQTKKEKQRKQLEDDISQLEFYQKNPVAFATDVLGAKPWSKQIDIMNSVRDYEKTAVRSCNGIGKTHVSALIVLWFLYCFPPAIVITTAPTWRQVEGLLWKEIRIAYNRTNLRLDPACLGGVLAHKSPELQIQQDEWYAMGISTNQPDRLQGYHQKNIMAVIDEAAGVPEPIHEAVDGILTSEHARLLLIGNPTQIEGSFFNAFSAPKGWNTIHVSAYDSPNFTELGITRDDIKSGEWETKLNGCVIPSPYLINPRWVADKYVIWGVKHPAYESRVEGDFPSAGEKNVIPMAWIEAAVKRYAKANKIPDISTVNTVEFGVDVARYGDDLSVIAVRYDEFVLPMVIMSKLDTMYLTGKIVEAAEIHNPKLIKVDEPGLGGPIIDRLKELGLPAIGIHTGRIAVDPRHYNNSRTELWFNIRDLMDTDPSKNPNPMSIPDDKYLFGELAGVQYTYTSAGKLALEPKDDTKERTGRSPDRADALVLAFAKKQKVGFVVAKPRNIGRVVAGGR